MDKLSENLTLTENQIALTENQIDEIKDLAKKFRKKREEIKDFHNKKLHEIEKTTRLVETKALDIRENLKNFHSQLKSLKNEASFKQEEDSKENISNDVFSNGQQEKNSKDLQITKIKEQSSNLLLQIKEEKSSINTVLKSAKKIADSLIEIGAEELKLEMQKLQTVDLCLMLDITGSMEKWIEIAKNSLFDIIDQTKSAYPCSTIKLSFIGYRDVEYGSDRFEILDFCQDFERVQKKLENLRTVWGRDSCEDVNGALQQVLTLKWKSKNRFLFHILDAPCHNNEYHEESNSYFNYFSADKFPKGFVEDIPFSKIFKEFIQRNIHYSIIPLNDSTKKMVQKFKEFYYEQQRLHKKFEMFQIHQVDQSVRAFLQCTVKTIVSSMTKDIYEKVTKKPFKKTRDLFPYLKSFERPSKKKKILLNATLLSSEIPENCDELDKKLPDYQFFVKEFKVERILYEAAPFATGSFNSAHKASLFFELSQPGRKMVLKAPLTPPSNPQVYFFEFLKINTITKHLASIFTKKLESISQDLGINKGISFVDTFVIKLESPHEFFIIEPDLGSNFKKFTNNAFFFDNSYNIDIQCLLAFSHWSFEFTNHRFMVTDLQGSDTVLTDSTLNTFNGYFKTFGDLGIKGIASFLATHQCNKICNYFKLNQKNEIRTILKETVSFNHYSTKKMVLECLNQFCTNDLKKGEDKFCSICNEEIYKEVKFANCSLCNKKFKIYVNLFLYENKEFPKHCDVCSDVLEK